jgi:hypothetical protein
MSEINETPKPNDDSIQREELRQFLDPEAPKSFIKIGHDDSNFDIPARFCYIGRFFKPKDPALQFENSGIEVLNVNPTQRARSEKEDWPLSPDYFLTTFVRREFKITQNREMGGEDIVEKVPNKQQSRIENGRIVMSDRAADGIMMMECSKFLDLFEEAPELLGLHQRAESQRWARVQGSYGGRVIEGREF